MKRRGREGGSRPGRHRGGGGAISMNVYSPAKINWALRILRRREDGFHELESLVSPIDLVDELSFELSPGSGFALRCDQPDVPVDGRNLIIRAACRLLIEVGELPPAAMERLQRGVGSEAGSGSAVSELMADWPRPRGVRCALTKRIPMGGGLGGGSSNAAMTLVAMNELWQLGVGQDRLRGLAAELGSDVPLFLTGGSVIMTGRGERLQPVALPWRGWVVLLLPSFSVSTAEAYRAWQPASATLPRIGMDKILAGGADCSVSGQPVGSEISAVRWMELGYNMLEEPVWRLCPQLKELADAGAELAGRPVRMSGSGSTLFTAFDERDDADRFAGQAASQRGVATRVVSLG